MRHHVIESALVILGLVAGGAGCSGTIADSALPRSGDPDPADGTSAGPGTGPAKSPGKPGGSATGGTGGGLVDDVPTAKSPASPVGCTPGDPPVTPRLVRLTRLQYENSLRDLTGLDVHPAAAFDIDPASAGYNRGLVLEVGDRVAALYRDTAESVAGQIAATPAAVQRITGCDASTGTACIDSFVTGFGKRVFRRTLTDAEKTRYAALFAQGATLVDGTADAFTKGVRVVVEALFQSPTFLYRQELSTKREGTLIPLSSFEVATRLSYMLANSTPDPTLLAAADRDELTNPDVALAQAKRILAGAAGKATLRDFHDQWMSTDLWDETRLTKDAKMYPGFTPAIKPALVQEEQKFLESVADAGQGLTSMLTAHHTFVTKDTAKYYGLTGTFGTDAQRVDLDASKRSGFLTQLGFLAAHAFTDNPSPIHRGVFVQRRLLCTPLPDPPAQVPMLPAVMPGQTNRKVVDAHTAGDGCASCHHVLINPVGFGFENYDAVGQWRTMDNGQPVDASGMLAGTQSSPTFAGPMDEVKDIAAAPETRSCYARQMWRYAFGRSDEDSDTCALQNLTASLASDSYGARDLLADMVRTRAFLYRAPEVQ